MFRISHMRCDKRAGIQDDIAVLIHKVKIWGKGLFYSILLQGKVKKDKR
jgi:hypothetical protein